MTKVHPIHNQIFAAGLALLLALSLALPLPANAAVHQFPGDENGIALPISQTWTGGGNQNVTYSLTPLGTTTEDPGYNFNTEEAVQEGKIAWTVDGATGNNPATFNMDGTTKTRVHYTWTKAGLYLFDLAVTSQDGSGYTYDHTVYRIRVYVRDVEQDYFVTAQRNPSNTNGDRDKASEITFAHGYRAPSDGGGDDGGNGGATDGDGTTPVTPADTNTTPQSDAGDGEIESIEEAGNDGGLIEDLIGYLTEWGDENATGRYDASADANGRRIATTGDNSNIILYGFISILAIIILVIWFIRHQRV